MNAKRTIVICGLFLLISGLFLTDDAGAIPAFARRYKISCSTCHEPFPRLKPFGEEFAGNGFIIPEEEKERDYVSGGDDLLHLNRDFPIAARFDVYALFEEKTDVNSDLQAPWGLKLLSGGALAKNIGYYFYFYMSERGEVAGIEDAYIHFNNLFSRPFDIMVGQFQTSDPLMKRELRLTYQDYEIYKRHIGRSRIALAYDRGMMVTYDLESTGTGLVGMVVNGNGKPEAGVNRKYDDNNFKNLGARVSQDLGSYFRLGYFYYYGEEEGIEDATRPYTNKVQFHGPDATLGNGMFDLNVQYLLRTDTNPLFESNATEIETSGVIGELVIAPKRDRSRTYFTLLYNNIDSDLELEDYETYTVGATYLITRNLRGTLEYTYNATLEINMGGIGLVSAF